MARAVVGVAVACALAGSAAAATGPTKLTIALYPQGIAAGVVRHYTLSCAPARGTVPFPGRACLALARLTAPFAPVPKDEICTQISLGPQEAIVSGTVAGQHVYARLRLNDGCQIERWRRVAAVVPGFPA
jgi:hypothetical protein